MCMIDGGDSCVQTLSEDMPTAKKQHKCGECHRTIEPGERYERMAGIWEGEFETYKTCQQCVAVRSWLNRVCGGWIYGSVREDLAEHFHEGYGVWLGRAAVGMLKHWRKRDGSLRAPMKLPAQLPTG